MAREGWGEYNSRHVEEYSSVFIPITMYRTSLHGPRAHATIFLFSSTSPFKTNDQIMQPHKKQITNNSCTSLPAGVCVC